MRVTFISADGLSLDSSIPDHPRLLVIRRLMNKRLLINEEPTTETMIQVREYTYRGMRDGIAIYEEMI